MLFAPAHGCRALLVVVLCLSAWPACGQPAAQPSTAGPAAETQAEASEAEGAPAAAPDEAVVAAGRGAEKEADRQDRCELFDRSRVRPDSAAHRFYQALVRRLPDFSSARSGRRGRVRLKVEAAPACPFCGRSPQDGENAPVVSDLPKSALDRSNFQSEAGPASAAGQENDPETLRPGEPAEVILEMRRRLGVSQLDDTDFSGPPDLLVKWIRALDDDNRRRQAEEAQAAELGDYAEGDSECDQETGWQSGVREQAGALRDASRQLQAAAELLEDQNLFESSDEIRALADRLREQSRQKLSDVGVTSGCNLRRMGQRAETRQDAKTRTIEPAESGRSEDTRQLGPSSYPVLTEPQRVNPAQLRASRASSPAFHWAMGIMR
jgi:hypothetical protein